jgi:acetyl-CoA carboxylase biotin carboxyl carrier protein
LVGKKNNRGDLSTYCGNIDMSINFQELRELIAAIANTDVVELNLKNADFELAVKKNPGVVTTVVSTPAAQPLMTSVIDPVALPSTIDKKWVEVKSPMVGTFYRAPAPDEPSFVAISDRIAVGQTVCIIEAMKLMNEIEAEASGQVMEILVENGQPVEFGQILMYVNPS